MKRIKFKTGIIFLIVIIMIGCKKKDNNDIYDPTSIVGKWQIMQYPEGCVGAGDKIIEFTSDSIFKIYLGGSLDFTSSFNIKRGIMDFDTAFYHDHVGYSEWELITLKSSDTLRLVSPILTAIPVCDHYKRKR
jgi:hypothetical protein